MIFFCSFGFKYCESRTLIFFVGFQAIAAIILVNLQLWPVDPSVSLVLSPFDVILVIIIIF